MIILETSGPVAAIWLQTICFINSLMFVMLGMLSWRLEFCVHLLVTGSFQNISTLKWREATKIYVIDVVCGSYDCMYESDYTALRI